MANNYQFLRGSQEENDAYVGEEGSITVDLTNLTLRMHDGVTEGGTPLCSIATILADLSGKSLDVDITGNASTADQADQATRAVNADRADEAGTASRADDSNNLEGSNKAYFRNASNLNAGTVNLSRLSSSVLTKSNLGGEFNLTTSGNHNTLTLPSGLKVSFGEYPSGSYFDLASAFNTSNFAPVAVSYNTGNASDQSVVLTGKTNGRLRFQTYTASGNTSNTSGFYIAIGE